MKMSRFLAVSIVCLVLIGLARTSQAGPPWQNCAISSREFPLPAEPTSTGPDCAMELTCTDRPVLLGHSRGMCFRASCSGVWALLHTRLDQGTFGRKFFSYRHYQFREGWDLKDQGSIEAGAVTVRELFLVLAGDLIELKLAEPDPHTRIEVRNLGYVMKGTVAELQQWLAYQTYWENFDVQRRQQQQSSNQATTGQAERRAGCRSPAGAMPGLVSGADILPVRREMTGRMPVPPIQPARQR